MCDSQPASVGEAVAAVTAGLSFLAGTDAASLSSSAQGECLKALEQAQAMHTAARANMLTAFHTGGGCEPEGSGSTRAWLAWQTKITRSAATAAVGWMRRLREHRAVWEALAAGTVSASWARRICDWTDRLPGDSRGDADTILLGAAAGGVSLRELAVLAEEMYQRSRPPDEERDTFGDRALYFAKTFGFAGRLEADLTPAASAALQAVLDSLGAKMGPEDVRSQRQRWHDALEEACVRLIASGMLPERAGQPVHLQLQITLDQLRQLAAGHQVETAWAARAAASGLTSAEAAALACDATIYPVITGTIDNAALDTLADLFLNAFSHGQHTSTASGSSADRDSGSRGQATGAAAGTSGQAEAGPGLPPGFQSPELLRQTLLKLATDILSGPAGLASLLRTAPGMPFPTVSLPLDTGTGSETIPGHLRRLIILRDKHCRFPGCWRQPAACHVHHLTHRADGGPTSLANCYLVCRFHHLIAIHRWGWKLTAHPDGTTTATHPNGRTLHSHPPPSQAA